MIQGKTTVEIWEELSSPRAVRMRTLAFLSSGVVWTRHNRFNEGLALNRATRRRWFRALK